jgi:hypothetical protein
VRIVVAAVTVGMAFAVGGTLGAAPAVAGRTPVPVEFGSDWADPRTAAPPVDRPAGRSCTTRIVDTRFTNFTPYQANFVPPVACRGPWRKVVLRLDGAVAGRQFDRLGYLKIGGVTVFKTSTPEPSPDGIRWSVEKDLTGYAALLATAQPVEMLIGNVVDTTYTGVLDVQVSLTFYPGRAPAGGPSDVLGLTAQHNEGTSLIGDLTVPSNTERLVADVYATGSGGGCEEFWYLTTPTGAPYSCPADNGPYREVQVRVDGTLAGVATPYPHIYTGGWSNPFLWYVIPAPRAFDIQPIQYDLTPFVGLLTDGAAHRVEVSVLGVPVGQSGWDVPTTVLAWRDAKSSRVTGALTAHREEPVVNQSSYAAGPTPGTERRVVTEGRHGLTVSGYVDTSHGRVSTTVARSVGNESTHRWNEGETSDALVAAWTDDSAVTVRTGHERPSVTNAQRRYAMNGTITVDSANRITTTITLTDGATSGANRRLLDTYSGEASWLSGVPRDQRHATGTSTERFRLTGADACYDHTLGTVNGVLVTDLRRC